MSVFCVSVYVCVCALGFGGLGGHQKSRPTQLWPPWPNGQGVGLLIRRLRVRVPQGVQLGRVPVGFGLPQLAWRKVGTTPGAIGRARSLSLSLSLPLSRSLPFPPLSHSLSLALPLSGCFLRLVPVAAGSTGGHSATNAHVFLARQCDRAAKVMD